MSENTETLEAKTRIQIAIKQTSERSKAEANDYGQFEKKI